MKKLKEETCKVFENIDTCINTLFDNTYKCEIDRLTIRFEYNSILRIYIHIKNYAFLYSDDISNDLKPTLFFTKPSITTNSLINKLIEIRDDLPKTLPPLIDKICNSNEYLNMEYEYKSKRK